MRATVATVICACLLIVLVRGDGGQRTGDLSSQEPSLSFSANNLFDFGTVSPHNPLYSLIKFKINSVDSVIQHEGLRASDMTFHPETPEQTFSGKTGTFKDNRLKRQQDRDNFTNVQLRRYNVDILETKDAKAHSPTIIDRTKDDLQSSTGNVNVSPNSKNSLPQANKIAVKNSVKPSKNPKKFSNRIVQTGTHRILHQGINLDVTRLLDELDAMVKNLNRKIHGAATSGHSSRILNNSPQHRVTGIVAQLEKIFPLVHRTKRDSPSATYATDVELNQDTTSVKYVPPYIHSSNAGSKQDSLLTNYAIYANSKHNKTSLNSTEIFESQINESNKGNDIKQEIQSSSVNEDRTINRGNVSSNVRNNYSNETRKQGNQKHDFNHNTNNSINQVNFTKQGNGGNNNTQTHGQSPEDIGYLQTLRYWYNVGTSWIGSWRDSVSFLNERLREANITDDYLSPFNRVIQPFIIEVGSQQEYDNAHRAIHKRIGTPAKIPSRRKRYINYDSFDDSSKFTDAEDYVYVDSPLKDKLRESLQRLEKLKLRSGSGLVERNDDYGHGGQSHGHYKPMDPYLLLAVLAASVFCGVIALSLYCMLNPNACCATTADTGTGGPLRDAISSSLIRDSGSTGLLRDSAAAEAFLQEAGITGLQREHDLPSSLGLRSDIANKIFGPKH